MTAPTQESAEPACVVLTGANGQLGRCLSTAWQTCGLAERAQLIELTRADLDIADEAQVNRVLDSHSPRLIINAAAYTAVDKAESQQQLAVDINAAGPENLARWAAANGGASLIHVSTDFVFDGAASFPYTETSATAPLGVYGASKREGELRVLAVLPHDSVILRTSWLYSEHGANFVKTMLRLMAERDSLSVVNDQIGSPTSAHSLAAVILTLAEQRLSGAASVNGLTHWSDGGAISWFDFAVEIQRQALELGLLNKPCELRAIPSSDYPTPAQRPAYSVLDRSRLLGAGINAGLSAGVGAGVDVGAVIGAGEGAGFRTGASTDKNTERSAADNPQSTWQAQLTLVLTALAADNTRQANS